jgi:hypothetical protein
LKRTFERRPDLIERRGGLSDEERAILAEYATLDEPERNG